MKINKKLHVKVGDKIKVMSGNQKGNILSKVTTVLSVLFMANSILLAIIQSLKSSNS